MTTICDYYEILDTVKPVVEDLARVCNDDTFAYWALCDYVEDSIEINNIIRKAEKETRETYGLQRLFKKVKKLELKAELHLFRGVYQTDKDYIKEDKVENKCYTSTSTIIDVAQYFGNDDGFIYHIIVPKDSKTKMLPIYSAETCEIDNVEINQTIAGYTSNFTYGEEHEVLLDRDTTFAIMKDNKEKEDNIIKYMNEEVLYYDFEMYYQRHEDGKVYFHNNERTPKEIVFVNIE